MWSTRAGPCRLLGGMPDHAAYFSATSGAACLWAKSTERTARRAEHLKGCLPSASICQPDDSIHPFHGPKCSTVFRRSKRGYAFEPEALNRREGETARLEVRLQQGQTADYLNFVVKESSSNRWYDSHGSNFHVPLRLALSSMAEVTIDEEVRLPRPCVAVCSSCPWHLLPGGQWPLLPAVFGQPCWARWRMLQALRSAASLGEELVRCASKQASKQADA